MSGGLSLVAVFLRWLWWRAVLHNGWWLVTSLWGLSWTFASGWSILVRGSALVRRSRAILLLFAAAGTVGLIGLGGAPEEVSVSAAVLLSRGSPCP